MLKPGGPLSSSAPVRAVLSAKGMSIDVTLLLGLSPTVQRGSPGMSMEPGLAERMRAFAPSVRAIAPAGPGAIARMLLRQYRVSDRGGGGGRGIPARAAP